LYGERFKLIETFGVVEQINRKYAQYHDTSVAVANAGDEIIDAGGCSNGGAIWISGSRISKTEGNLAELVTRDAFMQRADRRYPEYGFRQHKGYATASHLEALARVGPCPLHRRSFHGVGQAGDEAGDASLGLPF
jgi:hypothetical protein